MDRPPAAASTTPSSPVRAGVCAGLLLLGLVSHASEEPASVLGEPTLRVDRIAPSSAFEGFELPQAPRSERIRLAAREPRFVPPRLAKGAEAAEAVVPKAVVPKAADPKKEEEHPEAGAEKPQANGPKLNGPGLPTADESSAEQPAADAPVAAAESIDPAPAVEPKEPPAPLSRSLRYLRSRLRTVLSYYYRKPMNTVQNTPWELMHGMLAYELHSRVLDGGPRGTPMTAVGHLCFNRPSHRQRMMSLTLHNDVEVAIGVGLQGHSGQLLAMLAQCNVSPEYPIRVDGKDLKIRDLIASEQKTCYTNTELTFKLIGLGHYLASDAEWKNDRGENWDIPRLIREERNQPIRGAACGGTHRLAGLSLAYRRREARGEPIDGEYLEAARFVSQYQTMAFRLQNSDGSLSTEWFRGRGAEADIERRIRTTGHLLEWLVYSLPDEQLRSPRAVRAVSYLTNLLASNANFEWHPGSLGHALHALVLYDKRVFQPLDDASAIAASDRVDPSSGRYRGYSIYRGVMRNTQQRPSGLFGVFGQSSASRAGGRRTR